MTHQQVPREASPRAIEGSSPLASTPRGRTSAPHLSHWLPLAGKVAIAVLAAVVLAIVGATAGARPPATIDAINVPTSVSQSAPWASVTPPQPAAPSPPLAPLGPRPAVREALGTSPAGAASSRCGTPEGVEHPAGWDLAASSSVVDAGAEPSSGVTADGRVILNVATEDELTRLPGIGPVRARAIVALRQRLAKFRAVEDLLRVHGIGRKTLRRIKSNAVLDRPLGGDAGLS